MSKKAVVLGIEGLNPDLVDLWSDELTNLSQIHAEGIWGKIKSTLPTVSPVSWACVQTGQNPGAYGFWDYQYRDDFSYGHTKAVNSKAIQNESIYQYLTRRARKVAIVGVPVTSPPPRVHGGFAVSCFMHQGDEEYTWPNKFKSEVEELVGKYLFDVISPEDNYRSINKEMLLENAKAMDEQRFKIVELLYTKKFCDFVFAVFMGADRVSKVFFPYHDKNHKGYEENPKYNNTIKEYYKFLDQKIGEIKTLVGDKTILVILSNQGAQRIDGSVNLNEWLLKEGYLTLINAPSNPVALSELKVDWSRTKAWSAGNAGQIYINLKGRETQGIVDSSLYDRLLAEISDKLKTIQDNTSKNLKVQLFKGKDLYAGSAAAYAPDLVTLFNDGCFFTNEKIGYGSVLSNYDQINLYYGGSGLEGYYSISGPGIPASGKNDGNAYLVDMAPTILSLIGEEIPESMEGQPIVTTETSEEEKIVMARLKSMGY